MAEKRTRRRFTAEFKAEAVKRLLDGGKGLGEVATELGLSPGQLSGWRNEHLAVGSAEALAARKAEQAELQRLKRENKRLEEEVGILRKAAAFLPGGSREQVRVRRRRAGEPCRRHAVPRRRRMWGSPRGLHLAGPAAAGYSLTCRPSRGYARWRGWRLALSACAGVPAASQATPSATASVHVVLRNVPTCFPPL